MRSTKSLLVGVAAVGLAAAGLFATPSANAATAPKALDGQAATTLADRLGADRTAGTYLDQATGKAVVTVTDAATADAVRASGAVAKLVTRSSAELKAVTDGLYTPLSAVAGTAWAVDPTTNQVLVSVDESVTGAKLAKVRSVVAQHGAAARLEQVAGTFRTFISGGDAIYGGGARCSLGFNAQNSSGQQFFVTAGHCTDIASTWTNGSSTLGTRVVSSFPGNDFGVVRYTGSVSRPGNVNLYSGTQDITSAANPSVNQSVQRSGSTTGLRSGRVTALNQTVNYGGGDVVGGLIRTTVCAQPGDSGGPLFSGSTAFGITSGGSGNCSTGGTTFFQPVVEALNSQGLSVY